MEKELERNWEKWNSSRNKIQWNQNGNGMENFRLKISLCNRIHTEQKQNGKIMENKTTDQVEAKFYEMEWKGN